MGLNLKQIGGILGTVLGAQPGVAGAVSRAAQDKDTRTAAKEATAAVLRATPGGLVVLGAGKAAASTGKAVVAAKDAIEKTGETFSIVTILLAATGFVIALKFLKGPR